MKKIILGLVATFSAVAFAQDKTEEAPASNWTKKGNFSILFNQTELNDEWQGGGISNLAGNFGLNYDINYKNGKTVWDNKFIVAYGITKSDQTNDKLQKTDDRLEINSLWGREAAKNWYFSAFANFKTQLDQGVDTNGVSISHFFSPAYLQIGPGMLWKKSDNLKVNIAPATARGIYVADRYTEFGESFGVEQGENFRFELGATIAGYYKFSPFENVTFENILNLYQNYLKDFGNMDVDYTLNAIFKVNKYLSANFAFQAIYDDNAISALQVRQVFGLGFNYGF